MNSITDQTQIDKHIVCRATRLVFIVTLLFSIGIIVLLRTRFVLSLTTAFHNSGFVFFFLCINLRSSIDGCQCCLTSQANILLSTENCVILLFLYFFFLLQVSDVPMNACIHYSTKEAAFDDFSDALVALCIINKNPTEVDAKLSSARQPIKPMNKR